MERAQLRGAVRIAVVELYRVQTGSLLLYLPVSLPDRGVLHLGRRTPMRICTLRPRGGLREPVRTALGVRRRRYAHACAFLVAPPTAADTGPTLRICVTPSVCAPLGEALGAHRGRSGRR